MENGWRTIQLCILQGVLLTFRLHPNSMFDFSANNATELHGQSSRTEMRAFAIFSTCSLRLGHPPALQRAHGCCSFHCCSDCSCRKTSNDRCRRCPGASFHAV